MTSDHADITWTVELGNTKASWREFDGQNPNGPLRNSHAPANERDKLEITPGARSIAGPNQAAAFDNGEFTDWSNGIPKTVSGIYLGEIQTDNDGRLLVLGGQGQSGSPYNR